MAHPARRVRTLRLRAPSETLVRRGAILLEDALHTASLPEAGGRLLVIRSLNAGTIRGHHSPASIALRLEQEIRRLGATAMHAESPGADTSPAVYFHDQLEACISLARRIARQQSTAAWFWPLAVKVWRREMPRDESLRALLGGALQTDMGAAAGAVMLGELHAAGAAAPLLSALRWQDGGALLRMSGWRAPITPTAFVESLPPPDGQNVLTLWLPLLGHWARQWGADDPRSFWLSATALLAENAGRAHNPQLMDRAQRLLKHVMLPDSSMASQSFFSGSDLPGSQAASKLFSPSPKPPKTGPPSPHRRLDSVRADSIPPPVPAPSTLQGKPSGSESRDDPDSDESGSCHAGEAVPTQVGATVISEESRMSPAVSSENPEHAELIDSRPTVAKEETALWRRTSTWSRLPQPTNYGGLFFLVAVLERLGMADWLAAHSDWIEQDFPPRLLLRVLQLLGANQDDPIFASLTIDNEQPSSPREFIAPVRWLDGIARGSELVLRQIKGSGDSVSARILSDGTGLLTLALWRGRAPQSIRDLIRGRAIRRGRPVGGETDFDLTLRAWLTALRRWCRRYLGVGVREIVCRPSRVVVTRTHVDVLFDLNQADARLRLGGLDLNRGWVPYLGRVVTFHYLAGERSDER